MEIKIVHARRHLWQDCFGRFRRCFIVPVHHHTFLGEKNISSSAFFKGLLREGSNSAKSPRPVFRWMCVPTKPLGIFSSAREILSTGALEPRPID